MFLGMKRQSRTTGNRHGSRKAGQNEGARETTVQGETLVVQEINIKHHICVLEELLSMSCVNLLSLLFTLLFKCTFMSTSGVQA